MPAYEPGKHRIPKNNFEDHDRLSHINDRRCSVFQTLNLHTQVRQDLPGSLAFLSHFEKPSTRYETVATLVRRAAEVRSERDVRGPED